MRSTARPSRLNSLHVALRPPWQRWCCGGQQPRAAAPDSDAEGAAARPCEGGGLCCCGRAAEGQTRPYGQPGIRTKSRWSLRNHLQHARHAARSDPCSRHTQTVVCVRASLPDLFPPCQDRGATGHSIRVCQNLI